MFFKTKKTHYHSKVNFSHRPARRFLWYFTKSSSRLDKPSEQILPLSNQTIPNPTPTALKQRYETKYDFDYCACVLAVRSIHVGCSSKCREGSAVGGPDKCSGCQRCAVICGGRYCWTPAVSRSSSVISAGESPDTADSLSELTRSLKHQEVTDAPLTIS